MKKNALYCGIRLVLLGIVIFTSSNSVFASTVYTSPQGSTLDSNGVIVYAGTDTGVDVLNPALAGYNSTNFFDMAVPDTSGFFCFASDPFFNPCTPDIPFQLLGSTVLVGDIESSIIVDYSPENASTTASTSVDISASVYNLNSEYSQVHFKILNANCDPETQTCPDSEVDIYLDLVDGYQTVSTTTNFLAGQHLMFITLEPRTGYDSLQTSSNSGFTVVTANNLITYNPADIFASTTTTFVDNCADSNGTLVFVICRLFVPSAGTWNRLQALGTLVLTKPPAGYFTQIRDSLMSATSTASSTIGAFSVISGGIENNFFTPIKTGIASILWFFFLVHFYHRLRNIHI